MSTGKNPRKEKRRFHYIDWKKKKEKKKGSGEKEKKRN